MNKSQVVVLLLIVIGCASSKTMLEDLRIEKSIYYKDSNNVYSGHAFTKFESGKISNDILIEDGIPSGEWVAYGYQGEIVQKGNYKPVILNDISIQDLKRIRRINICEIEEGGEHFIDIFIVSADCTKSVDKTDDKEFRNALLKVLRVHNVGLESSKINKVIGVNIELGQ